MSAYLSLSPFARNALTPDEVAGLHARVAALGCLVSVQTYREGGWTIYASDRAVTASRYGAKGSLAVAIHAVLDEYREKRAEVDADVAPIFRRSLTSASRRSEAGASAMSRLVFFASTLGDFLLVFAVARFFRRAVGDFAPARRAAFFFAESAAVSQIRFSLAARSASLWAIVTAVGVVASVVIVGLLRVAGGNCLAHCYYTVCRVNVHSR